MAIDLKALSPKELQALIEGANAQMKEARGSMVQEVRKKIDTLLGLSGLTLDEVYPTRGGKSAAGKKGSASVAPKYRNPDNAMQTWSGRGKRPLWLSAALKKRGVVLESFLIEGAAAKAPAPKKDAAKKASAKKSAKK